MDATKDKELWQISNIKNDARTTQMPISNKENLIGINEYYKQIENYTQQIRSTDDLNEIINILDVALIETKNLYFNGEVKNVRGHVHRTGKDIETLKNELEALQNLVHTDQLTGALNRAGFDTSLVREASDADRHDNSLCLVTVNIDDFKVLTDVYGNQAGNRALSHLVNVIKESLRPSDIVARFGLEEFVILLPNTTLELATQITSRLQNNLGERSLLHVDKSISITFSAGIAVRARYEHQNSVIGRADRVLHVAKLGGKKSNLCSKLKSNIIMNNSFEIIGIYEAILTITGQMLKAAQGADWERLITLEHECRGLTKKLMISDENKVLSSDLRQRKQEIIQQILADDAEIRILTQPWMAQLQNILSNPVYKRCLQA